MDWKSTLFLFLVPPKILEIKFLCGIVFVTLSLLTTIFSYGSSLLLNMIPVLDSQNSGKSSLFNIRDSVTVSVLDDFKNIPLWLYKYIYLIFFTNNN